MFSKFKVLLVGIVLLQAQTCKKEDVKDIPSCILAKIELIKAEKVWNPPASIWQYEYNGKTVYYIPQRCCDIPSGLYDQNCNLICNPDGGFSGNGDGKCEDFFKARKNEKLIWKDERN